MLLYVIVTLILYAYVMSCVFLGGVDMSKVCMLSVGENTPP